MKKKLIIFAILLSFTACSKPKENTEARKPNIIVDQPKGGDFEVSITNSSSDTPNTQIEIKNEAPNVKIVPQGEVKYDKENDIFGLTEEEIKLYEDFSKNFDKTIFIDVDPKSIFKIWITAGISKAWETEYKLYSEQSVKDSKLTEQEFYNLHIQDLTTEKNTTRKQVAEFNFKAFKDATWSEGEGGFGYLVFDAPDSVLENGQTEKQRPFTVTYSKNPAGYWELVYYPIS